MKTIEAFGWDITIKIRIYYSDDAYDDGLVSLINENEITVDFFDWIEVFQKHDVENLYPPQLGGNKITVAKTRGEIIRDFRK